ncbi:hypothetical protein RDWZM_004261 [Blomia tropicalis]|uniref:Ig-like domain-containing protein n=1 Tax=Blomia tropicalis TaxID=40697 RepID=A0A9Q0RTR5_BLOTA|nr:hypothetical protein RDWZM_004261 [Blomia tropicalis]
MLNLTVPMGRDVTFECVVNNLGSYKIAWLKMDNDDTPVSEAEIISIQTQIVLNNSNSYQSQKELRYRVSHNNHRQWFLHIKQIKSSDRVAPSIDYNATSADISVDERHRLSIRCRAKGYPSPTIVWRREDNKEINLGLYGGKRYSANKVEGEFLNITQVTRDDMGAYLCIASNSVPPSVSKRIIVRVNFRPKIKVSNQLVGSIIGSDVQLECRCEASPTPATSWIRHDGQVLAPSNKYQLREEHDSYKTKMKLKIMSLDEKDFGSYKCVAKNTIGEKEGLVRLYEIAPPASTPSGGDPMWPTYIYSYQGRKNGFNRSNQNQNDDNKNYDYSDYQQAASTSTAALYRCNDNLMLLTLSFIITILITYIRC